MFSLKKSFILGPQNTEHGEKIIVSLMTLTITGKFDSIAQFTNHFQATHFDIGGGTGFFQFVSELSFNAEKFETSALMVHITHPESTEPKEEIEEIHAEFCESIKNGYIAQVKQEHGSRTVIKTLLELNDRASFLPSLFS